MITEALPPSHYLVVTFTVSAVQQILLYIVDVPSSKETNINVKPAKEVAPFFLPHKLVMQSTTRSNGHERPLRALAKADAAPRPNLSKPVHRP
jgi:hypothetical protein